MFTIYGDVCDAIYAMGVAWYCISRRLGLFIVMGRMGLSNVDTMEIGFRYPLPPCGWLITMNEDMMSKAVSIVMFVTLAVLEDARGCECGGCFASMVPSIVA